MVRPIYVPQSAIFVVLVKTIYKRKSRSVEDLARDTASVLKGESILCN